MGFGLPAAEGSGVAGFAEGGAAKFETEMFGHVDAFAVQLDVVFVFLAQVEHVLAVEVRQDASQRLIINVSRVRQRFLHCARIGGRVVE